jgi:hypothetical protein
VLYANDNIAFIASAQYHLLCSSKSQIEIQSSAAWFICSIWNNPTVQRTLSPSFLTIARLQSQLLATFSNHAFSQFNEKIIGHVVIQSVILLSFIHLVKTS